MSEFTSGNHAVSEGEHVAYDSATVRAYGSATVTAYGSATVRAYDSATVRAYDSATVTAHGSATVRAYDFSAVHVKSKLVKIVNGPEARVIRASYPKSVTKWAAIKGITVRKRAIRLWKAVREDGTDFYTEKISYLAEATAPDWDASFGGECGNGLHLADSPSGARWFVQDEHKATFRLFEVEALVKDCRCFPGQPVYPMKLRARACKFVREVPRDYDGE